MGPDQTTLLENALVRLHQRLWQTEIPGVASLWTSPSTPRSRQTLPLESSPSRAAPSRAALLEGVS
jgi:hypothetical protein